MIVPPFILDAEGWHADTKRHYAGRIAELVADPSLLGAKYRAHFLGLPQPDTRRLNLRVYDSCIHRGKLLDRTKCGVPIWQCHKRGTCSTSHNAGVTLCQDCLDFRTKPAVAYQAIRTRHLCYHIYPVSGNGAWQWNVEQLCGRLKAFNGKKIVAIVTDPPAGRLPDPTGPHPPDRGRLLPGCDSAAAVKEEFARRWGGEPITFLEMENDPHLREVKSLMPMLELIPQDDPHSVTLYAQAKGTTRHPNHIWRRWTEALYEVVIDHFPLAMEQLMKHPVTGAFKKLGPGWSAEQSKSDWHYSGSWFWFRNTELFARDWRKVDQFWSGIEPYPSQQFLAAEADCMFHTARVPEMNLYAHQYWRREVLPALQQFRTENSKWRTDLWPK